MIDPIHHCHVDEKISVLIDAEPDFERGLVVVIEPGGDSGSVEEVGCVSHVVQADAG